MTEHHWQQTWCVECEADQSWCDFPPKITPIQARVADWLAKEYGDFLPDSSEGYWDFQAKELLEYLRVDRPGFV